MHLVLLIFFSTFSSVQAQEIIVDKLRTIEEISAEYCRTATGGDIKYCGKPSTVEKLDVIHIPFSIGKRIEAHINSAFEKKYFFNLDKKDLFHGHFMAKGPQTVYANPKSYFADLQVVLYHSQEYLLWKSIPDDSSPFVPHDEQRSFAGSFVSPLNLVISAIELIRQNILPEPYDDTFLRGYKRAGTIYTEELNEFQSYSQHKYTNFGGHEKIFINTCEPTEEDCTPCTLLTMAHIFEAKDGRFTSPDGKVYDIVLHCEYLTDSKH